MPHAWDSDESLLEDLRDALTPSGPVPPEYLEAARAAYAWRTVDAELLLLTSYDSALDDDLLSRARSTLTARQLVFDGEELSMQVEVTEAGVAGQFMPPGQGRLALVTAGGIGEETTTDELGCFLLGPPPGGPVRFRCELDGRTVLTDWVCM